MVTGGVAVVGGVIWGFFAVSNCAASNDMSSSLKSNSANSEVSKSISPGGRDEVGGA